ncbi:ABC transporter ATP-binding protein [Lysinibacillus louembei]|uniref:ABC transporter ATP-binding protein n=1 Tax=Lysinibacillus louembei TaxID=1470088 RepID=A0ABZ0RXV1_9BACI|nr:ABC transporter ATP-binding protein [Lysinibacillus louembei]WPK12310.1 ABC transporter ATP-binding protein [Lysinibacillus louembei]
MELQKIIVSHDGKKQHLQNISTAIQHGKITTIIGPNGCGKSTLLNVMARNNSPVQGKATLDNKDLVDYKPKEFAQKFAIVYQQNDIPQDLSVERLVGYGRMPYHSLLKKNEVKDQQAVDWALACTSLSEKRHYDLSALSGGERQRVWIAMALAQQSELLCLDEPTTYLDIYYQLELLELVKELNEKHGLTIVMVLHDINQAIRYSDHIILMSAGRIVAEGAPRDVITKETVKDVYGVEAIFHEDVVLGLYMVPIGI